VIRRASALLYSALFYKNTKKIKFHLPRLRSNRLTEAPSVINRRAIQAQFGSAKANQLSAMYAYQKTILNGYVEVVNELSGIGRLQEISALKRKQNELLLQSVDAATELYRTAKASYLEVLIVQQQSLQTQLETVEVERRQKIATISLYKALGGGW